MRSTSASRDRAVATIATLLLLTACQPNAGDPTEPQTATEEANLTFALDYLPSPFHAFYFEAVDQGLYADQGLNVEFVAPDEATTSVKLVGAGQAEVGIIYGPDLIVALGEGLDLIAIANLQPTFPIGVVTLPGAIESPADLEGQKVGLLANPSERAAFDRMMATAGGDPSEVTIIDPGFTLVPPLVAGQIAAVSGTSAYEQLDCNAAVEAECDIYLYSDWGVPRFNYAIVANRTWAEENPEQVQGFLTATLAGLKYELENPEEATRLVVDKYPEYDYDAELAKIRANAWTFVDTYTSAEGLGYSDPAYWAELLQFFLDETGGPEGVTVDDLYTNDHLPSDPIVPSSAP